METSLTPKRRVTQYGVVRFGEMGCDAVVLDDGSRGYLRRQMAQLIGLNSKNPSNRFAQICADFAPKSLSHLEKSESPILMPHGGNGQFFPAGVVPDIANGARDVPDSCRRVTPAIQRQNQRRMNHGHNA
jgi:hypothetical protein